jgi:hypothetical protein
LFELCFEIERSLRIVSVDGKALERERKGVTHGLHWQPQEVEGDEVSGKAESTLMREEGGKA